ncbi:hypothetical protein RJ639_038144 [Escallonia herrerae]|uniref:Cytochrome b561 and DOMON domain-containing protein n=1 Tax=Escallonia herrerae TaxID=1293975 RepID=A0AA89B6P5_9ASTE|nr:hypothetical protein RJ639_038144 [Escallonia herrerae]
MYYFCHFPVLLILVFISLTSMGAYSHPCSEDFLEITAGRNVTGGCKKLNTLGAEFRWNHHPNGSRIDIAFGAKLEADAGWVAWGVNPGDTPQMVGTRALIGIKQPNGSLVIYTYNITRDTKRRCQLLPSKLDVGVNNLKFDYSSQIQYYVIYASLDLPPAYNISKFKHVWQVGYKLEGMEPKMHPTTLHNVDSIQTLDLVSGRGHSIGRHRRHLRTVHGILNIVGWGTLLPIGVIIARYFKSYPMSMKKDWWFALHISCQIVGYFLGTTGFIIGIWLGHASKHYSFFTHRILAIFIFAFTTLQMFALPLRPGENDEYREYWNMYHHFLGYALLAVISANIFEGIAILRPENTWKWAYIGLLGVLLSIALVLEIFTWCKFFCEKNRKQKGHSPGTVSQVSGVERDYSMQAPRME